MLEQEHVAIGISACNNYVVHARVAHSSGLSAGYVFDAEGKARAIYVVKRDEWCVLRLGY